jgi:hypothetical protein
MAMRVEIKDKKLIIEIDLEKPTPSSSGKTLVVASTRGNVVTTAQVDGKPVTIGLNAYIKPYTKGLSSQSGHMGKVSKGVLNMTAKHKHEMGLIISPRPADK